MDLSCSNNPLEKDVGEQLWGRPKGVARVIRGSTALGENQERVAYNIRGRTALRENQGRVACVIRGSTALGENQEGSIYLPWENSSEGELGGG